MDIEAELRKRFAAAINKFVQPRILFGPKWIRSTPGQPGRYQFIGTPKVAKATGIPVIKVAKKILSHLKLGGLDLESRMTATGVITMGPVKDSKPRGEREAAEKTSGAKPAKPAAKKAKPKSKED